MQIILRFGAGFFFLPTPLINIHEDNFTKAVIKLCQRQLENIVVLTEREETLSPSPPLPGGDLNPTQTFTE